MLYIVKKLYSTLAFTIACILVYSQSPTCNISAINNAMATAGFQPLDVVGFDCALYYYNPNATSNWFTARDQAAAVGATLVTINSQAENDAIWQAGVAAGLTGGLWIGYTDRITEGVWLWEDGSTSTFTNWNPGEPNNTTDVCSSSGEDAAIMQMSNGRWNDVYINPGFPCISPASYRSLIKVNICPEVTVSASSTNICQGQSTSLNASTLFGSPNYTYSWENVSSGSSAGTGTPLSVSPQSSTTYQVTSTDRYECTATESITVNVIPSAQTTIDTFLCAGQTILVNGNTYGNGNNSGTEVISLPNGCDSIVVVNVTPLGASDTTASTQSICNGESFLWNGQTINSPGVYYHSISALDSVFPKQNNNPPLLLTANLPAFSSYGFSTPALYSAYGTNGAALPDASPNGFTYEYLTHPFWTGNGVVANRITTILGRWIDGPSTNFVWYGGSATINIPTTQTYYILLAADNEFRFFLDGTLIVSGDGAAILATQPGGNADQVSFRRVHIYPLEIQAGCRVITLEAMNYGGPAMFAAAILDNTAQELIDATSINDLNFVFSTQNETSFYTGTPSFSCPVGSIELGPTDCDSCQVSVCGSVFELTVLNTPPSTAIDIVTACSSFTWINGVTYNSSTNTPTFTIPNGAANGCDSIVTLNLTINLPQSGVDTRTACNSFTWINGITYNSSTNIPTFTIPNGAANGCDSIVTLNLTINLPQSGVDIRTACNSFTWINGVTYNSSTNTPTFTLPNGAVNGCDSIVTLNLTINQPSNIQTTVFTCNENEVGVNVQNLSTAAGCDSTHTVTTILDAFVDPLFTSISPVCIGANAPLLQSVSLNNISGSWSPLSVNTNLVGTQVFTFIPDNNQCANEVTLEVEIVDLPQIIVDDYTMSFGTEIQLQPDITGNDPFTFLWSPADGLSCTNCENPTATPFQTTQYLLTVTDENGCISSESLTVNVTAGFYIPDAFTPNGDGINDVFEVYGGPFATFKLHVYNRWGEKVFESNNQNSGWNGFFKNILQNPDVYVYYFEGEIVPGEKIIKKGSVTLIR